MTPENRILEPSEDSENWVMLALEDSVHYFPSFGRLHQTLNCWCQPTKEFDETYERPMFSHNEVH
jgi:hypothetical protein